MSKIVSFEKNLIVFKRQYMVENENRRNTFCKLIVFLFNPRDKRQCMENGNENRK